MKSELTRQDDGTLILNVAIPWEKVKVMKEGVLEQAAKSANMPGFRKGKAPKKMVEDNADQARIREEILRSLLPEAYMKAVEEHDLKPILNPKVQVEKVDDNEDWTFTATTCEMPKIDLKDYKKKVKDITAKSKIAVPGKEEQKVNIDEIMKTLGENVEVSIPHILIDQEVDRQLSQTLEEIKRLGLSLDQYMASTNKTPETLRSEFEQKAIMDMKMEFALQHIAEEEKITVEEKEIEAAIANAKDPREKEHLTQNKYLLASILRQQKTVDFLRNL